MRPGDHLYIAQSQTESGDVDRFFVRNPEIAVVNQYLKLQRDSYSPVLDRDAYVILFQVAADGDPLFGGRVLDGIVRQIQQRIAVMDRVGLKRRDVRSDFQGYSGIRVGFTDIFQNFPDVDLLFLNFQFVRSRRKEFLDQQIDLADFSRCRLQVSVIARSCG